MSNAQRKPCSKPAWQEYSGTPPEALPCQVQGKKDLEASPVQTRKEQGKRRGTAGPEATSTYSQPQLPREGNPSLGQSLVKQENIRLSWALLYPTAQWPRSRVWLSTQKSTLVHRHRDLVLGCRREGADDSRDAWPGCCSLHLFSIRICTL